VCKPKSPRARRGPPGPALPRSPAPSLHGTSMARARAKGTPRSRRATGGWRREGPRVAPGPLSWAGPPSRRKLLPFGNRLFPNPPGHRREIIPVAHFDTAGSRERQPKNHKIWGCAVLLTTSSRGFLHFRWWSGGRETGGRPAASSSGPLQGRETACLTRRANAVRQHPHSRPARRARHLAHERVGCARPGLRAHRRQGCA
jgi:hypothetical protein